MFCLGVNSCPRCRLRGAQGMLTGTSWRHNIALRRLTQWYKI
jgi:hypothetical protein